MSSKLGARAKTPSLQLLLGDQDTDKTGRPPRPKPLAKKRPDECPSPGSQVTTRTPIGCQESERGVLSSETSAYYLVRSQGKWVPVSKANLLDEDGTPVARGTDFSALKGRKVQLTKQNGGVIRALLLSADADYASADEAVSVQSTEAEDVRSTDALERMARMTSKLFADLAAISQYCKKPDADPGRIDQFLRERKHTYRKHSVEVLEDLRDQRSSSLRRSHREISQLIGNFPSREEKELLCDWCHGIRFAVMFSCGHRACRRCAENHHRCCSCKSDFSSIDRKLLLLDRYKAKRCNSSSNLVN